MKDIYLRRFSDDGDSTLGGLYIDSKLFAFTLEDEFREVKKKGETRIPAGVYKLGIKKSVTPLTEKYRNKYSWFKYHIEILNVAEFQNVYIHIGNYETHTDGCVLLGSGAEIRDEKSEIISKSTERFKKFYNIIYPLLEKNEMVRLIIEDC